MPMPLKLSHATRADFDALPESVRALYVEKDGRFVLDIEGAVISEAEHNALKTKVAEFRENNTKLTNSNAELSATLDKFKDIDPAIAREAIAASTKLKGKLGAKDGDDIEAMLNRAIDARVKPIEEKLTASEQQRTAAQAEAARLALREKITGIATKAGVNAASLRHVLREAEETFEVKDGAVVAREGKRNPVDALKDYTPEVFIEHLERNDPYLFKTSSGTGADGGNGGVRKPGGDAVKVLTNPTPEEKGRHMADIASGKVRVEFTEQASA